MPLSLIDKINFVCPVKTNIWYQMFENYMKQQENRYFYKIEYSGAPIIQTHFNPNIP